MSEPPRLSVLLPVRDAVATLPAALRSIARQRETRFECVIADDGSTDGSLPLARRWAADDARFRVLALPRRGLVEALTEALAACRAPVVARMDADDVMHRDRLAAQLAVLDARPELAAVGTHVRIFPRAELRDGMRAYESWLNAIDSPARVRAEAFVECPVAHPTLAVRRGLLAKLGYRDVGWPEDYDLLLRLLASGNEVGVVPRRLLAWRDAPGRLSRRDPRYGQERFTACKAAHLAEGLLRGADQYVLWGYGGTGRALHRALLAHGKRPSRIVELHPGRLGNTIHGSPVVPPEALRDLPRGPLVASVAGAEPRARIRAALAELGYRETRDFVCAA